MDSNTKIIILVLILVFIKFFAHTYDNFANTSQEGEQCTTTVESVRAAKCEKRDNNNLKCLKYSCPIGLKLSNAVCLEKKKVCSPSNIDNFANTSPEGEQCTTTIDNIRPAKCEKIDMMGVCQKYSCPIGLKLVDDICLQKNKVCSPSNIDKFANTSR